MRLKPNYLLGTLLLAGALFMTVGPVKAQFWPYSPDNSDFATEYCRYYKTRALFARHRAETGVAPRANKKRYRVLWSKYRACLLKYAMPSTYIPPK